MKSLIFAFAVLSISATALAQKDPDVVVEQVQNRLKTEDIRTNTYAQFGDGEGACEPEGPYTIVELQVRFEYFDPTTQQTNSRWKTVKKVF
ncbi:MAG: hypothetical protein KDD25_07900, partial [Bdellovibrionales bacterium]|nr:hypothetical protein [Bdellovibrionales bacterium]